ncbi:MAG: hypothetical protein Q4E22_01545 [Coriobacteriia bacterium]|nr:hypothetical protein [Coriobacteriia bacterium]
MSYKKIVAGIATAAVASALVVPAAFAGPIEQDNFYPEVSDAQAAAKQDVKDAEDVLAAANLALKNGKANNANKEKANKVKAEIIDVHDANPVDRKPDDPNKLSQLDLDDAYKIWDAYGALQLKNLDDLQNAVDAAEAALKAAKADADYVAYLNLEKVWDSPVYKDARKSADKHAKNSLERGQDVLDELAVVDLVSLKKTYEDQVRAIEQGARKLQEQMRELDGYKDMAPNRVEVLARELDQTIEYVLSLLAQISDSPLAKAEQAAKADAVVKKKAGSALPKTSDVAPVAPIAALAGSAALIAAGLVASRKVNA